MRNPDHEMFNSRQVLAYNHKTRLYQYRGKIYTSIADLTVELYLDSIAGVGITYLSGKNIVDFTLSAEDNQTPLVSVNEEEWEPYHSFSQVPNNLQFAVFCETLLATIEEFQGDR
jgi:hypothetical protein